MASRPLAVSNEKCVWRDVDQDEVVLRLNNADTRVLEVVGAAEIPPATFTEAELEDPF